MRHRVSVPYICKYIEYIEERNRKDGSWHNRSAVLQECVPAYVSPVMPKHRFLIVRIHTESGKYVQYKREVTDCCHVQVYTDHRYVSQVYR